MPFSAADIEELQLYQLRWDSEAMFELVCVDCETAVNVIASAPPRRDVWGVWCKGCMAMTLHTEVRRRPVQYPA